LDVIHKPMKKTPSTPPHKPDFTVTIQAKYPPSDFDAVLIAITRARKSDVAASIAREKASKQVRAIAKGRH
jgi:hypothetical protein